MSMNFGISAIGGIGQAGASRSYYPTGFIIAALLVVRCGSIVRFFSWSC